MLSLRGRTAHSLNFENLDIAIALVFIGVEEDIVGTPNSQTCFRTLRQGSLRPWHMHECRSVTIQVRDRAVLELWHQPRPEASTYPVNGIPERSTFDELKSSQLQVIQWHLQLGHT